MALQYSNNCYGSVHSYSWVPGRRIISHTQKKSIPYLEYLMCLHYLAFTETAWSTGQPTIYKQTQNIFRMQVRTHYIPSHSALYNRITLT